MFEKPPTIEQSPNVEENVEHLPNKYEIGSLFEKFAEGKEFTDTRKLENEKGLYLWDR